MNVLDEKSANSAARAAMGETAWPTIALAAGIFIAYPAILALYLGGALSLWLAFALISILVYMTYTVAHEAVHGSICGKNTRLKWLNEVIGLLGGQLMGASFTAHRKEHFAHHNHTNHEGRDPDLPLSSGSLWRLVVGSFLASPQQIAYFATNNWRTAPRRDRVVLILEVAIGVIWRAVLAVYLGLGPAIVLLVVANVVGIFITLVLFAWLVHWPHNVTGRYQNTGTFVFSGPVDTVISWLWFFQNYHSIHHLFPRVPFYRYRQVFREIEPLMVKNGTPIRRIHLMDAPGPRATSKLQ